MSVKHSVAAPKHFLDEQARSLRIEYTHKHLGDDSDDYNRTIFCCETICRVNGALSNYVGADPAKRGS